MAQNGAFIDIGDTQLHVVERGRGYPLLILHGGPGLDHHMFGDYLDGLADDYRLLFVDQRAQGRSPVAPPATWNLERMAADVSRLADGLGVEEYAVLGHSFGAFVTLQHAVDFPGAAARSIVSSGLPSARFLEHIEENLQAFEPADLREQVQSSWEREQHARSQADVRSLLQDQMPFQFMDPFDPKIQDYAGRTKEAVFSPDVLRHFARQEYGAIELENRLGDIPQPVLILAGRHDRTCAVAASELMAEAIPDAEFVVFEESAHMTFVEENEAYVKVVRDFLDRHRTGQRRHGA